ncbi:hypothetical protein [Shimia biformata]|uniref:hypothetical protein n=1 Tax=Shimia biformata TaxID=1294299 RepID=UPI001950B7C4|nr:hypothetical protein [Shimia biformata]
MLLIAALLLVLVGLMHSVLGGRRLIAPLLARPDLPVILGSQRNSRVTLWAGWHLLTLFWWGQAVVLMTMQFRPDLVPLAVLVTVSACCGIGAGLALVLSRGRHLSWLGFLPIAVLTAWVALSLPA